MEVKLNEQQLKSFQVTMNGLSSMLTNASASAQATIQAEMKLAMIMEKRVKTNSTQMTAVKQLALAQEKLGVVDYNTTITGAQVLAGQLKRIDSYKRLIPVMDNVLVWENGANSTGKDAVRISKMMAVALAGNTKALEDYGIALDQKQVKILKGDSEEEKAILLAKLLTEKVGRLNAAYAGTDVGKITQACNLFKQLQDEIGQQVIPVLAKMGRLFLKLGPDIRKNLLPTLSGLANKLKEGIQWVIVNWPKVAPIVEGVTAALISYRFALIAAMVAEKAAMIITGLTKAWGWATAALALMREGTSLMTIAQMELNLAMNANPIGLIITLVTALGIAGYYVYKYWKPISKFFKGVWEALDNRNLQTVVAMLLPLIGIPVMIIKNWKAISGVFQKVWKAFDNRYLQLAMAVINPLIGIPVVIIKNWKVITGVINKVWRAFDNPLLQRVYAVMSPMIGIPIMIIKNWKKIWKELKPILSAVGDFFVKIFGNGTQSATVKVTHSVSKKPGVPRYALGTSFHPGGLALVGEQGPELVNLPAGSRVIPNHRTERLLSGSMGKPGMTVTYAPQYNIQGNADREVLEQAGRSSYSEFERNMNAFLDRRRRLSFVGA